MKVSFAIGFGSHAPADFIKLVRLTEEAGFDIVATGDTPTYYREQYVSMTLAALNTRSCKIGSFVTNPVTRHPVVVASAWASLQEVSGGRAFLGISTGDAGVKRLGLHPARVGELEEYIRVLKKLWAGEAAVYRGASIEAMRWKMTPAPVYVGAAGPKTLRMAGRVADGVFVELGVLPETVAAAMEQLSLGAKEEGRRVEDIDVWWYIRGYLAADRTQALTDIRSGLASSANHCFRGSLEGKLVPRELEKAIKTLVGYHPVPGQGGPDPHSAWADLVDELGLRDYLAQRFAIAGTAQDWAQRLRELSRYGVRKVVMAGAVPDIGTFVTRLGREVISAHRS